MAGSIPNHFKGPYLGWIGKRLLFRGKYRRFPWVLCRCVRSWAFLEGTEFFQVFLWIRKKGVGLLADIQGIERLKLAFRLIVAAFQLSQKMWAALFVRNEPQFLVVFGWELSSITETSLIIYFLVFYLQTISNAALATEPWFASHLQHRYWAEKSIPRNIR